MKNSVLILLLALTIAITVQTTATQTQAEQPKTDTLNEFVQSNESKNFSGSPITLQLKDADIREVMRMIGDASGFNIVIHPAVQGKISLSLEQVPWDQALEVVLNTMGLGADRSRSVLRVMPRDILILEKQKEMDVRRVASDASPRVTRVFPVSYADMGQLVTVLTTFIYGQRQGNAATAINSGTIIADANTNSIIVRDSLENIERIRKMMELLDVQTPQVLIEAKVVEASESFSKSLSGGVGIGGSNFNLGINGGDPTAALAGIVGASKGGLSAASGSYVRLPPTGAGGSLRAILSFAEQENKVKVVSSPKLVVLSGKTANISQSQTANIQVITTPPGGATVQTVQQIQAETRLNVSPRVTNDGSVFLKLDLSRGILNTPSGQQPFVEPRLINTEVIVESGSTLVIGGVLSSDETDGESGIPFLRKIPLIGWLFGDETKSSRKTELMFFVTPRILNPKKTSINRGGNAG